MNKGIFIVLLVLLNTNIIKASNNNDAIELKTAIKKSAIIFKGKLINKELVITDIKAPKIGTAQKYIRTVYTFEIVEIFKGETKNSSIKITAPYHDLNFNEGENYLVYAYFSKYMLTSNFYLNGEKVNPFLATDKKIRSKSFSEIEKKELKKLKRLARKRRKLHH